MGRLIKRGTQGEVAEYMTRQQALDYLQVTLADFRRLCIFKGIYPRQPRQRHKIAKSSDPTITFYYKKDIEHILHEPVLNKFRQEKTFAKKLSKALGKREYREAQRSERNRPRYTLDHIIRERYPSFLDAVRDMDDPLNMLFLFANMPATNDVGHRVTKEALKLTNHWLAYVARERLVTKVFVLIKGTYYEANVRGQDVRWLVPFKFPANIPLDVDFKIMLSFLELYSTLVHFVLFKLYLDLGLVYPPPIDDEKMKTVGGLALYVLQLQGAPAPVAETTQQAEELSAAQIEKAKAADVDEEVVESDGELDEFAAAKGDALEQPTEFVSKAASLFDGFTFYVGREVPMDIIELCILSAGGRIVSEVHLDAVRAAQPEEFAKLDLGTITHQIVDRPKVLKVAGRTYVQPQWVFDCINKAELLPVGPYAPGETLPPHLLPWGDKGQYNPEAEVEESLEEEQEEDVDEETGLELEAAGVKYSEAPKTKTKVKKADQPVDEEKELRKIMMTNRQRKLYAEAKAKEDEVESRTRELSKKRKQIEKAKLGKKAKKSAKE